MKPTNKSGIIFIENRGKCGKNNVYLCKCPVCGNLFEMWAGQYYRGDAPCKCTHYALKNKRLYRIWVNVKTRCYNAKIPNYNDYGGRGITVCDEWKFVVGSA